MAVEEEEVVEPRTEEDHDEPWTANQKAAEVGDGDHKTIKEKQAESAKLTANITKL